MVLILGLNGTRDVVAQAPNFSASTPWTDATIGEGLAAQWNPFVLGARPLGFQWFKDNEPLLNSTNESLLLTNVQFADAGLYSLQATNAFGSITSPPLRLTVVPGLELSRVGSITNAAWVYTVDIVGDLAYLGSDGNGGGLRIVDVADPASPALVGTMPLAAPNEFVAVSDVLVRGDRAYIAVSSYMASAVRGLRIIDVSNPSQPQTIAHHPTSATAIDLVVREPIVYLATAEGIEILDTSDVHSIRTVASYASAPVYTLDFDGLLLYAAATSDGIHVIDVSDPTEPRLVSLIRPGYWVDTVKVANRRLYCTGLNGGPTVYDISNPEFPLRIATNGSTQSSHGMNVLDDLILDGRGWNTTLGHYLTVFSAAHPSQLIPIGTIVAPALVESVEVHDHRIFVTTAGAGVDILEFIPAADLPFIVNPVKPLRSVPGTAAELEVAAIGGANLRYQWARNGVALNDATNLNLRIPSVRTEDMAVYSVLVENEAGMTFGGAALLDPIEPPALSMLRVRPGLTSGRYVTVAAPAGLQARVLGSGGNGVRSILLTQGVWEGR